MAVEAEHEIDARGLRCPEPVMMLHARIRRMADGERVRIRATDPSTSRDIPQFCDNLGHELVSRAEADGEWVFVVRKRRRG